MKTIPIIILISLLALICFSCSTVTPEFTSTPTALPATDTQPPTDTFTPLPPTETETPVPPTATETSAPPSATNTPEPSPTLMETEEVVVSCAGLENLYDGSKVRLMIINESGFDVYLKLEGCGGGSYIELTIPSGTKDDPRVKEFLVERDQYLRTTIQCNGNENKGVLSLKGNTSMTFVACESTPTSMP